MLYKVIVVALLVFGIGFLLLLLFPDFPWYLFGIFLIVMVARIAAGVTSDTKAIEENIKDLS